MDDASAVPVSRRHSHAPARSAVTAAQEPARAPGPAAPSDAKAASGPSAAPTSTTVVYVVM
ncbi:hypothetical protein LJK88_45175 [Paenibacillus sp. P26]|nr:hypothetical protein LJK88_45175 [Paenibacillus sp. P26]